MTGADTAAMVDSINWHDGNDSSTLQAISRAQVAFPRSFVKGNETRFRKLTRTLRQSGLRVVGDSDNERKEAPAPAVQFVDGINALLHTSLDLSSSPIAEVLERARTLRSSLLESCNKHVAFTTALEEAAKACDIRLVIFRGEALPKIKNIFFLSPQLTFHSQAFKHRTCKC